jgi:multidrug/hemolysin transport system ATP-binding protein
MSSAITVSHLVKRYGDFTAVDDISFEVPTGSVFAFLGTNGAGKTTTIGCLTTINTITSGQAIVNGRQIGREDAAIRRDIGVVFQSSLLDPLLTVRENLTSRAAFYSLGKKTAARIQELAKLIDLEKLLDKRYGTLSGGQKRRVDIARALLHNPSVLFLDEPTAGLDPKSREQVWQTIYGLQKSMGLTVFLTTHYMEETERADMVYVIDAGKVIAHGTPSDLRAHHSHDELRLTAVEPVKLAKSLTTEGLHFTESGNDFSVAVESSQAALALLKRYEKQITDFEFRHGSMDDVFLQLTDHAALAEEVTT